MTYNYEAIVPFLLDWYDYNARILPWRENPKPYYVWVSEIMLQQTRVEAVKGYFDRFITVLPDIQALAEVEEEKLLKLWEGLGYYNRARNLQKAARVVMENFQGELPSDYETLLTLPGIGTYTAGAIASIAFQKPVPVVDGNVLRVMKRIAGSFDDITKDSIKKELWQDLKKIIPKERPGDFNQSMMELGATVCLPNGKPLCEQCPVMHLCHAFHEDKIMQIPVKPPKKERRKEERTILLIEFEDRFALRKREDKGLLAGLWELPSIENKLKQGMVLDYFIRKEDQEEEAYQTEVEKTEHEGEEASQTEVEKTEHEGEEASQTEAEKTEHEGEEASQTEVEQKEHQEEEACQMELEQTGYQGEQALPKEAWQKMVQEEVTHGEEASEKSTQYEKVQIESLGEAKHIFSHVEWHMVGYHIKLMNKLPAWLREETFIWANREELMSKYSIPNAFAAYIEPIKRNNYPK